MSAAPPDFVFERTVASASDGRVVVRWRLLGGPGGNEILSKGVDFFTVVSGVITLQDVMVGTTSIG